jgi:hypothetical protein
MNNTIAQFDKLLSVEMQEQLLKPGAIAPPDNYFTLLQKIPEFRQRVALAQFKCRFVLGIICK